MVRRVAANERHVRAAQCATVAGTTQDAQSHRPWRVRIRTGSLVHLQLYNRWLSPRLLYYRFGAANSRQFRPCLLLTLDASNSAVSRFDAALGATNALSSVAILATAIRNSGR